MASSDRALKGAGMSSLPPPKVASGRSASGVRPARSQSGVRRASVQQKSNTPSRSPCICV